MVVPGVYIEKCGTPSGVHIPIASPPVIYLEGIEEEVLVSSIEQLLEHVPDGWPLLDSAKAFFFRGGASFRLTPIDRV